MINANEARAHVKTFEENKFVERTEKANVILAELEPQVIAAAKQGHSSLYLGIRTSPLVMEIVIEKLVELGYSYTGNANYLDNISWKE